MNSNQASTTPSHVNINGYIFQSPKLIANLMNDNYYNKTNDIMSGFSSPSVEPIEILEQILPSPSKTFKMPYITSMETRKLILRQKNSSSTGYDAISNKTLRKIAPEMAPIIAHLINSIIRTGIFPNNLKVSKIIPILKPGKPSTNIDSFRPVNCLPAIEKLVEEWLKINLTIFFNQMA